jgi:hypothetical protein
VAAGSEEVLSLPLSQAVALAHAQEVSLDWLAGRSRERGLTVSVAARFDGARFADLRRAGGLPEAQVRQRLPLGPYRQLLSGAREPSLSEVAALASIIGVPMDQIVV